MKVILREDIPKLGKMGEVVEVADGYGRNYLLPRRLAVLATERNVRAFEHERRVIEQRAKKLEQAARAQAEALAGLTLTFARAAGEGGRLFGSVTAMDIEEALAARGHAVDRRRIELPHPIKTLGTTEVKIRLLRDVTATVRVEVVPEAPAA
ncbi:MAG TPA: 50S ribosomal protein L9 [Thermodesulfobacteriota bacterium]|nr:50S ribosomal protein L9 [Thermodesulfobacteriota bacterium]